MNVLDLGNGDGRIAKKFKSLGTSSYLGIEGSEKMFSLAQQSLNFRALEPVKTN